MNSSQIYFDLPQLLTMISLVLGLSSAFWLVKSEVKKLTLQESQMRKLTETNQREIKAIYQELQENRLEIVAIQTEFAQIRNAQTEIKTDVKKLLSLVQKR